MATGQGSMHTKETRSSLPTMSNDRMGKSYSIRGYMTQCTTCTTNAHTFVDQAHPYATSPSQALSLCLHFCRTELIVPEHARPANNALVLVRQTQTVATACFCHRLAVMLVFCYMSLSDNSAAGVCSQHNQTQAVPGVMSVAQWYVEVNVQ